MRWLRTLGDRLGFGRKHPRLPDSPDDWRAGDMAECIATGLWFHVVDRRCASGPVRGEVRMVVGVHADQDGQFLHFARYRPRCFQASGFRKLTPRADQAERATEDVLSLGKPVVPAAPVAPAPVQPEFEDA